MATRYSLYGGGQRADAITGLDPDFLAALDQLYQAAPPEMQRRLGIGSGYRSVERQRELWDASDKSGKWVARPGHSKHNHGQAVDFYGDGRRLDKAPPEIREWIHANAPKFGLNFPMSHESWHVEPVGARGGGAKPREYAPQAPGTPAPPMGMPIDVADAPVGSVQSAPAVAGNPAAAPQPEQGGLGALFAAMAPNLGSHIPAEPIQPVQFGSPDGGAGATMAAQQGVDLAKGLSGSVMPDLASLIGLGKRRALV